VKRDVFLHGALALLLAAVLACAAVGRVSRAGEFGRVSDAYHNALRWSDFETAKQFGPPSEHQFTDRKPIGAEHIKVTSCEIRHAFPSLEHTRMDQYVDITYYDIRTMKLQSMEDHQVWEYNPTTEQWHIMSGLPVFE
jgi:hypothetical protein